MKSLKSPSASIDSEAILPGPTIRSPLPQLSQVQYGVNAVPLLANIWKVVCHPPKTASSHFDIPRPNALLRPNGRSYPPYSPVAVEMDCRERLPGSNCPGRCLSISNRCSYTTR